ncbi:hypothetical protein LZL83_22330, partial [Pseudomonas aeruginosa]|nr:hypothetical protein [Pseudomonas aeruginosa]
MTMTFQHDDLPLALYSAAQVRDLDARLIAAGTPGFELMQRAAHAAWRALRRRWPEIGVAFGGRDHTTVLHACRKIAQL